MYNCPYCNKEDFKSWRSVSVHTRECFNNDNTYIISDKYGPIYYTEYLNLSIEEFNIKYIGYNYTSGLKKFKNNGLIPINFDFANILWTNEEILKSIKIFVSKNNKIPKLRDFQNTQEYPNRDTVQSRFGSWNNAIKEAGFQPSENDGFGINTEALDGHIYRSQAEAYFVDNYLWNKYEYIIEPKYPNNLWRYDWYVPSLDLYIELDGGLRPERIKEKIELNKNLNRNFIVIKTNDIYKNDFAGIAQR